MQNNSTIKTTEQHETATLNRLAPNQAAAIPTASAIAPERGL